MSLWEFIDQASPPNHWLTETGFYFVLEDTSGYWELES